jgi:hypothetical protein
MTTEKCFKIEGIVCDENQQGLAGLIVEALDKDFLCDDRLGSTRTDDNGRFEIAYNKADFSMFFEQKPDIYLRVKEADGTVICTTENKVRYEAGGTEEFRIGISRKEDSGLTPDRRPLTTLQAKRLAALTNLNHRELVGNTVAKLSEKLKWKIDPELLRFQRICGRVVKTDPSTGLEYPVPFATVHVEDTDFHLLGYSPPDWPWSWFFPLHSHREEVSSTRTDACGRFCVWVPRWEIDWILHWRHLHFCEDIFILVNICDLHPEICELVEVDPIKHRIPKPDPTPWIRQIKEWVGENVANRMMIAQMTQTVGKKLISQDNIWNTKPLRHTLPPPPLSPTLKDLHQREDTKAVAKFLILDQQHLEKLDLHRYWGPFKRCFDIFLPEWYIFRDVPDITFRVTQDVNGDGTEETIYSEGFSEIRWNAGPIPDVTLEASQIAIAGVSCNVPDELPCAEPSIVMVGLMPLSDPVPSDPVVNYHDNTTGYALRPNSPRSTGKRTDTPSYPAKTPFCWDLQLRGCNRRSNAKYYRINYSFEGSSAVPIKGLAWKQVRWVGSPGHMEVIDVVPDGDGWYEILDPMAGWLDPYLLLNWPTRGYQDGLYVLTMEFAKPDKSPMLGSSTLPIELVVDNSRHKPSMSIRWRTGAGLWTNLGYTCPIISRHPGEDIEFEVKVQASLKHLRSLELRASGCGAGIPSLNSLLPAHWYSLNSPTNSRLEHWHTNGDDNSVNETINFLLPSSATPGVYSFYLIINSRTFNPAGGDGGLAADWHYDPVYIWQDVYLSMAVVNV